MAIGVLAQTLYYDLGYKTQPVREAIEWHGIGGPDRVHCDAIANVLRKIEARAYLDGLNDGRRERP